jgi:Icc-related predicted phosphoesterase
VCSSDLEDADLENIVPYMPACDIVVSHSPPFGILDNPKKNYGVKAWNGYLINQRPELWICGHIHESYGTAEVKGCKFHNVAMCDRGYAQTNKPHIIDL